MNASTHRQLRSRVRRDTDHTGGVEQVLRLKVLIADDDPAVRKELQTALQLLGYECRVASDGREALELHQSDPADVIVSADRLPRMDGLELCRSVRAADRSGAYTYFVLAASPDESAGDFTAMQVGADGCLVKPVDFAALQCRLLSVARMHAVWHKLAAQNAELRRQSLTAFRLARVDPLTGVRNRLRMDEDIAVIWAQARRYSRLYCVALCDIDWFKSYNDAYGHLAGDDVLRRVARTIRAGLRQGDVLYRYGGEEFLVLLPEQSAADGLIAMDRVRHRVERLAMSTPTAGGVVTISVGVAALLPSDDHPLKWLARADRALYAAKARGRNRVEVADGPASRAA
jgi:diguanylate cyclase (GGDEF)-like protein